MRQQAGIITIHRHHASQNSGGEGRRGGRKEQQIIQEDYTNIFRAGYVTVQDPGQQMKTLCKKRFKVNGKTPSSVLRISFELLRGRGSHDNFSYCHLPASQLLQHNLLPFLQPPRFPYFQNSYGVFLHYISQLCKKKKVRAGHFAKHRIPS